MTSSASTRSTSTNKKGIQDIMATNNNSIIQAAKLDATGPLYEFLDKISNQAPEEQAKAMFDPYAGPWRNQFVNWLFTRVGRVFLQQNRFEDPLRVFAKESMPYGGAIQMSALDYIKAQPYSDEGEGGDATVPLLKVYRPKGKTAWAWVNTRRVTPVTYNEAELQQAFTEPDGLARFVAAVLDTPVSSDNYQEYLLVRSAIATFDKAQPNTIYREVMSAAPTAKDPATDFLTSLKTWANRLRFPNWVRQVTPGDMPNTYTDPSQLVLLVTPEVAANLDTRTLQPLFHWAAPVSGTGTETDPLDYRVIIVDDFGIPGCFAALVSENTLNIVDVVRQTTTFYNPANLSTSIFVHTQQSVFLNPFEPCLLWGTGDTFAAAGRQTVTITQTTSGLTLTASSATVKPGGTVTLSPKLTGSLAASPSGSLIDPELTVAPDSAVYTVEAKDAQGATVTLNSKTYVDGMTNVLHVGRSVPSGTVLTITATATYTDPTSDSVEPATPYTATTTVTVE